jgi:hypothetical protein
LSFNQNQTYQIKRGLSVNMKKLLALLFIIAIAFCADAAYAQDGKATAKTKTEVIKKGEPLGKSPVVALTDVMKDPQKFAGKKVIVKGVIVRSCKAGGCWMELASDMKSKTVRVTFDHKFFIPLDAQGMKVKAEGEFTIKTLSKEEVDHLVNDDGAKVERNADGTATEITFLATGVELRK